jgi:hypothetical protein
MAVTPHLPAFARTIFQVDLDAFFLPFSARHYSKSIFSNPSPCNRLLIVEAAFCRAVRKIPSAKAASCI